MKDPNRLVSSLTVGELTKILDDCIHQTGYLTYAEAKSKYHVTTNHLVYHVNKTKKIAKCHYKGATRLCERDIQILLGIF